MIPVWLLVLTICVGGECDEYIMDSQETVQDCLAQAPKYVLDFRDDKQYIIGCEQTVIVRE